MLLPALCPIKTGCLVINLSNLRHGGDIGDY